MWVFMDYIYLSVIAICLLVIIILLWQINLISNQINLITNQDNTLSFLFRYDFKGILKNLPKTFFKRIKDIFSSIGKLLEKTNILNKYLKNLIAEFEGFYHDLGDIVNFINKINSKAAMQNDAVRDTMNETNQMIASLIESSSDIDINNYKIQTTTNNMKHLIDSMGQVSDYIKETENLSKTLRETSQDSQIKFNNYTKIIQDISQSSSQIDTIVETINNIADKTNVLSINASVEAARAGKYGKGFAVVSKEIGNLAQQVNDAASRIKDIIRLNTEKINQGIAASVESNFALNRIIEGVNQTSSNIQKIHHRILNQDEKVSETVILINDLQGFSDKILVQTNRQVEESGKVINVLDKLKEFSYQISQVTVELTSKNNDMFNKLETVMELLGHEEEDNVNSVMPCVKEMVNSIKEINEQVDIKSITENQE